MRQKKVLIVTYYWPPAGGPGVQRWLKFSKYLPEDGWMPIVYTPENPSYPFVDETLLSEVPTEVEVLKTKIWEPYQLAEKLSPSNKKYKSGQFDISENQNWKNRLSIWIRGNFFIPDARVFWVKPSVKYLKKYLEKNKIDALVTTGPPHSVHLIGLRLKKYFPQLKWMADFRDPWTDISYYQHLKISSISDKIHHDLERKVLTEADWVLATSYSDSDRFKSKGANSVCITNGFDETQINDKYQQNQSNRFIISYVGVLEQLRNPENLWLAIKELMNENSIFAQKIELRFVGKVDEKIINQFKQIGLEKIVQFCGYLTHQESVMEMKNAQLLVLTNFENKEHQGIIPGKLFEYLVSGREIISFGPENSDVEKILNQVDVGKHFIYGQKNEVKNFILKQFERWQKNGDILHQKDVSIFSRKKLTKDLVKILES